MKLLSASVSEQLLEQDSCQPIIEINLCFVKLLGFESKFFFFTIIYLSLSILTNALVHNICSTNFLLSFDNNLGHRVIEISFKLKKNVGHYSTA